MPKYRATDNVPMEVLNNIDPSKIAYRLMYPLSDISWRPVAPPLDLLARQPWYNQVKFIDPNEINKKMKFPPNYIVLDPRKEKLREWISRNFKNVKFIKDGVNDIIFEGDFIFV